MKVTIEKLDLGFLVEVDCKKLAFSSQKKLIKELTAYLDGKDTKLAKRLKEECSVGTLNFSGEGAFGDPTLSIGYQRGA